MQNQFIPAQNCFELFEKVIYTYHIIDDVDQPIHNSYDKDSLEYVLFEKNWIDTVQWHLEDIIRDPQINAEKGIEIKRRIDTSNQDRTNMVEQLDDWFLTIFQNVQPNTNARLNTESPAWAIDRLSILALKIYHMQEEVQSGKPADHIEKCQQKLNLLLEQKQDLILSINQLLEDIQQGNRIMKVYRQMKMYNDPSMNPFLANTKG